MASISTAADVVLRPARRRAALALAVALGLATLGSAGRAVAQGSDTTAAAESLFKKGRELMKAGNYAEACPKFAESQKLDPSPGTLLNLAQCYEGQGKTASAWATYKEAATLAQTAGQQARAQGAKDLAAKLEGKLSKLRIDAPADPPGISVRRDGVAMGSAALGLEIAVDPGEHTVEAVAPGYATYATRVTVGAAGDSKVVTIPPLTKLPEGAVAPVGAPPPPPPAGGPTTAPAAPPPAPPADDGSTMRTAGFVAGGVGVVGLGLGIAFGAMASSQASSAEDDPTLCPEKRCTPAGRTEIDGASTKATISTIGFGVGIVGLGAGVALLLLAPSAPERQAGPATARVLPSAGPDGGGLLVTGSF